MKKTGKPKPARRPARAKSKESDTRSRDVVSLVTICLHCEEEAKILESQHRYVCLNGECVLYGHRLLVHHSLPHWD